MFDRSKKFGLGMVGALALAGTALGSSARAQVALTPAGAALFTLSTFADGFPTVSTVGPLGIGFRNDGAVVVSDDPGNVRVFPTDTDNQHAGSVVIGQNYGAGNAVGIAKASGNLYLSRQSIGDLVQINTDGTFNQVIVSGMPTATGVIGNPNNGHVFVTAIGSGIIYDVDPIAKTKAVFENVVADGLSTDGTTLFAAVGGQILGYNLVSKAQTFASGAIPGGADGAALGLGTLAGNIFVNTNSGTVFEINTTTLLQTLIASGGSRGDFATVDPNGSLLITQTGIIQRLTPLGGGTFVVTPEPGMLGLFTSVGFCGLAGLVRRRRARK